MEWRFWARTRPAHFGKAADTSADAPEDDCETIEPLLSLYGDGMASAAEAQRVEAHLPSCESCRESLAWMQATRRALTGRPVLSPPADLHARIAEAIAASEAAPLRLRPARVFATRPAFAAAASLTAVGLFLGYSLTHLPRPVAPHPSGAALPQQSAARVPETAPAVSHAPIKPLAPPAAVKTRPNPLIAANSAPDETPPAPVVTPEFAPLPRASRPVAAPPVRFAPIGSVPKAEPPVPAPLPAPRPHLKPVASHPAPLMAMKMPATAKANVPKPLPAKAPVAVARLEGKETGKTPEVQVLTPRVIPQESPAPVQTASATSGEPHVQNVDFLRDVHLPSTPLHFSRTVGISVRGAAKVTQQTFGQEGRAVSIGDIHSPNF